jgi:hydroxymethylpyrimidine pyrophosphatase-like HAD family hydrolase
MAADEPRGGARPLVALATDYDLTLTDRGADVEAATLAAMRRFKGAGGRLIMVTGRRVSDFRVHHPKPDLREETRPVMAQVGLFDLVVAENGAVLWDPHAPRDADLEFLGPPVPAQIVGELLREGVPADRLWVGKAVIATRTTHGGQPGYEDAVARVLARHGGAFRAVTNREALMVLPSGVDKAAGLRRACTRLGIEPAGCVGVGDAENDLPFMAICGLRVAVANAEPAVRAASDVVTSAPMGAGVREILQGLSRKLPRNEGPSLGVA